MLRKALKYHRVLALLAQSGLVVLSYVLAFMLRFDFRVSPAFMAMMLTTLPICYAVKILVMDWMGVNGGLWHYAGLFDLKKVFAGVSVASLLFFTTMYIVFGYRVPRSVYIIDYVLCLGFLLGIRVLIRIMREELRAFRLGRRGVEKKVLIIGAGDVGETATRMLERDSSSEYRIVGFLDDNIAKQHMRIRGYPILGGTDHVAAIVREYRVTDLLFAISNVPKKLVRKVVEACAAERVSYRILPVFRDIITGDTEVESIRAIQLEDLLGREPVQMETACLEQDIRGRSVLVTGAGGSIGSELCRQILDLIPARLVLLDMAESALFEIEHELKRTNRGDTEVVPLLCSVTDDAALRGALASFRPSIVYHAAAYKHVPMLEAHPLQAIENNVFGTMTLLDACIEAGVGRVVMISTDKAVRPANVMGATKRLAEMLVSSEVHAKTVTTAVRFGNVLGSNGSVVPIFKRQIETGGPVTVTHPEMTRFFMTIPEAVELVLHAGSMGRGGEIYILDMGEPVKILDMARKMIELSGKIEGVDIAIEFSGIRPGEKMYEELVAHGECVTPTKLDKIKEHQGASHNRIRLREELAVLRGLVQIQDVAGSVNKLWVIIGKFEV